MKNPLSLCLVAALFLATPFAQAAADENDLEALSEPSAVQGTHRPPVKQHQVQQRDSVLDISMSADTAPAPSAPSGPAGSTAAAAANVGGAGAFQTAFADSLKADGIPFTQNERLVLIRYRLTNCNVKIGVHFAKNNGTYVKVFALPFGKIDASQRAAVIVLCNTLNSQYKWCKFYLSKHGINLDIDVRLPENSPATAAQLCRASVKSMTNIVDEVYPRFMKALTGKEAVKETNG